MPPRSPFARADRRWSGGGPIWNSPGEGLVNLALLLLLAMAPGVFPEQSFGAVAIVFGLGIVFLASRSLRLLWLAALVAVLLRRFQPVDPWPDQVFVQLSSLAALLNGHGIYYQASGIGMSWSVYLPMANLLAALPIWFCGPDFWNFFRVLVPLIYSLPFWIAPSQITFRLFLVLAGFVPLAGTTSLASALELSVAVLFVGYWLLLRRRMLPLAAALLAYGAILRQPLLFIVPFVALALWRLGDRRSLRVFAGVLVGGGLVHVLRNPFGFVRSTFTVWADFADLWFHQVGREGNFSISTLLFALGDEGAMNRARQPYYLALFAVALALLVFAAWKRRTVESAVVGAILAVLLVHFLNRGCVLFHYLVAAALPALAFAGLERGAAPPAERGIGAGGRALAALVGAVIAALVVTPLVLAGVGEVRSWRPRPGNPLAVESLFRGDRRSDWFLRPREQPWTPLAVKEGESLRLVLAEPAVPRELVIAGAKIPPRRHLGVMLVYPMPIEVYGFLRAGRVEGSSDGFRWRTLGEFSTWSHPSFYPTRVTLEARGEPVRYLRIVDGVVFRGTDGWLLGGVEVYGTPLSQGPA